MFAPVLPVSSYASETTPVFLHVYMGSLYVCAPLPPPRVGTGTIAPYIFLGIDCRDVVWCGRGSCYSNKLSLRYLTNSCSKKEVNSRTFRPQRFSSAKTKTGFGPLRSKRPAINFLFATWIAQIPQRKSLVCSFLSTKIILHTHLICVQTKIYRWHTDSLLIDSIEKGIDTIDGIDSIAQD